MITKVFKRSLNVCFTNSASYTSCGNPCRISFSVEVLLRGFISSLISFMVSLYRSFEMIAITRFMVALRGSLVLRKFRSYSIMSARRSLSLQFLGNDNLLFRLLGVPRLASDMVVPTEEAIDAVSDFSRC